MRAKYVARSAKNVEKKQPVGIALDAVTRVRLELAARRTASSFSNFVVQAAVSRCDELERELPTMHDQAGNSVTMRHLAALIADKSESRQFMRMALIAPELLKVKERLLSLASLRQMMFGFVTRVSIRHYSRTSASLTSRLSTMHC